ncbi:MAG TPA: phage major capsid protein [Nocardioides sp.]
MSAQTIIDNWIPIEWDDQVLQRVLADSAVERYGHPTKMTTATKRILRSAGLDVNGGSTYTADASDNDYVTLTARKINSLFEVDEDDLADVETVIDTVKTKGNDWAISYADHFDNAALACSGAENGSTVLYTSVYKALRTTNSATGYTADDNYLSWNGTLAISSTPDGNSLYEKLSSTFALVENGKYWSAADQLVIASPSWRSKLRTCLDGQGRPIFTQGSGGTPDMLFESPIAWSRGCKVSATNTQSPTGNGLLIYGNRQFLKRGDRSMGEILVDKARAQDTTDNTAVKIRVRKGFVVGHEGALAALEDVS